MVTSSMFNSVLTRYVKRKKENTTSSHIVGNVGTSHRIDRVVLVLSTSTGTGRSPFSLKSGDKQILLSDAMATPENSRKTTSTMKIDNAASFSHNTSDRQRDLPPELGKGCIPGLVLNNTPMLSGTENDNNVVLSVHVT